MNNASKEVEQKVLEKIVPDKNNRLKLETTIEELKTVVLKHTQKISFPIEIELVGSTAKDTYLRNSLDIDLFLCFPSSTSMGELEKIGLSIGRKVLTKREECFAEHPYLRGEFKGYKTEIVPCYKIESASQKLSAVDRTPLHTTYVTQHLKEKQKNEVRLLKQFLKGIGCYGAEAEVEGFSGYLCEILILKYNSFQNLLVCAQHWRYGEQLFLHNETLPHFDTPLIFIDPIDSERNVSSALSKEKFDLFIKACKAYLTRPQITFFFPNKIELWSLDKIRKEIGVKKFIGLIIKKPEIIAENLYPQVRKAVRSIIDLCTQYDFKIIDSFFHITNDSVYIVLHPEKSKISETMVHMGPPVNLKKNAEDFIEKWINSPRTIKKPFDKNGRLYVEIKREYIEIKKLLEGQIGTLSLGKHIDHIVQEDFTILERKDLLKENLCMLWTEYLDKKMPWNR